MGDKRDFNVSVRLSLVWCGAIGEDGLLSDTITVQPAGYAGTFGAKRSKGSP